MVVRRVLIRPGPIDAAGHANQRLIRGASARKQLGTIRADGQVGRIMIVTRMTPSTWSAACRELSRNLEGVS